MTQGGHFLYMFTQQCELLMNLVLYIELESDEGGAATQFVLREIKSAAFKQCGQDVHYRVQRVAPMRDTVCEGIYIYIYVIDIFSLISRPCLQQ